VTPYILKLGNEDHLVWHCPGCRCGHRVPVTGPKAWTFNGDIQSPTLSPSVLVSYEPNPPKDRPARCHCFIQQGTIVFQSDCDHAMAGKIVPITPTEDSTQSKQ